MSEFATRSRFWLTCLRQLSSGVPYVWGGKADGGCDCSGFVTLALYKASDCRIDWRNTHNTDALWGLPRIVPADLLVGDLVLYWGRNPRDERDVSHVMVWAGNDAVIGQPTGGPSDTDAVASRNAGQIARAMPVHYRHDVAGFVRLPIV